MQRIRSSLALEIVFLWCEKYVCCGLWLELEEASWRCKVSSRSGISRGNRYDLGLLVLLSWGNDSFKSPPTMCSCWRSVI